jgi:hypothetical protein
MKLDERGKVTPLVSDLIFTDDGLKGGKFNEFLVRVVMGRQIFDKEKCDE